MTKHITEQIKIIQQAMEAASEANDHHETLIEELKATNEQEKRATGHQSTEYRRAAHEAKKLVDDVHIDVVDRFRQVELGFSEKLPKPDKMSDTSSKETLDHQQYLVKDYHRTIRYRITDLKTLRTRQANRQRMQVLSGFGIAIIVIGIVLFSVDLQQRQQAAATATQAAMNANSTATQSESNANATATQRRENSNATATRKRDNMNATATQAAVANATATQVAISNATQALIDANSTATQVQHYANVSETQAKNIANATATEHTNATATHVAIRLNINTSYVNNINTWNYDFPDVVANADWIVYERDFDGTTMVLVPVGCFMMGSEDGDSDERPVHKQCIEEPFWLDKYEVTNLAYGGVGCEGYSSRANEPRNCVVWLAARAYCENRGGRLPSEVEWEWAARGPESWAYPWGNEFEGSRAVFDGNSNNNTVEVGNRATGASWVGAQDMAGNVWEWTRSGYREYPYKAGDGREGVGEDQYVLRGGSFNDAPYYLRSANRGWGFPDGENFLGFRCSRSL